MLHMLRLNFIKRRSVKTMKYARSGVALAVWLWDSVCTVAKFRLDPDKFC